MSGTGVSISIEGAEELKTDIEKLIGTYRSDVVSGLRKCAKDFTKDVNAKYPSDYMKGDRPIPKAWKIEAQKSAFTGITQSVEVRNTAPHFHLVENGHKGLVPIGKFGKSYGENAKKKKRRRKGTTPMKDIGFVAGRHQCKTTRDEWAGGKFVSEMTAQVDEILKKNDL